MRIADRRSRIVERGVRQQREVRLVQALVILLSVMLPACGPSGANQSGGIKTSAGARDELRYDKSIAFLKLSQISPQPELPAPATSTDQTSDRASKQIENARELFAEDRYAEAIQRLERALRYSPNSLSAHQLMARVCLQAGNGARATEHLQRALLLDEAGAEAHYLLGRARMLNEKWPAAMLQMRTLPLCDDLPQHHGISVLRHYFLAHCLAREGYLTAAIQQYQEFTLRAGEPWPENADPRRLAEAQNLLRAAHSNQGELHELLDQPTEAARALGLASTFDPENLELIRKQVELFAQARLYEPAIAAAMSLAEKDIESALPLLISIRRRAKQSKALLADLRALAEIRPKDDRIVRALADEHVLRGKPAQATDVLREFVTAHPENAGAATALANLLVQQQRWLESIKAVAGALDRTRRPEAIVSDWLDNLRREDQATKLFQAVAGRIDDPQTDPQELFLIARVALLIEKNDFAERALRKCRRQAPDFAPTFLALGRLYLDTYRWQDAVEAAKQARALLDHDFRPHRLLGEAYLGLDDYDQAVDALNEAVRLNRSDLQSIIKLAESYERSGKTLQNRRQNQIILEIDPTNAKALQTLFLGALEEQEPDRARQYLDALEKEPRLRGTYRRCQARWKLEQERDLEAFVQELQDIAKDHPTDLEAHMDLAEIYGIRGQFDLMEQELDQILLQTPNHFGAQEMLCGLRIFQLKYDWAVENLRARLAIHPNRPAWQQRLASVLIHDQQYEAAAKVLQRFLQSNDLKGPDRSLLQYDLLMSLVLSGSVKAATDALHKWVDEQPQEVNLRTILIHLYRLQGNSDQAVELARRWLQECDLPDRNTYQALLLVAYWADERFDAAEILLLDWLEIDPDAPDPTRRLLTTYHKAGKFDDAIELARSITLETEALDLVFELVRLYHAKNDHDAALRVLRDHMAAEARKRRRNRAPTSNEQVLQQQLCRSLIFSAGRFDVAERELTNWLSEARDPRHKLALLQLLSTCYQYGGKHSLAVQQLEEIYRLFPDGIGIKNDLGYTWAAAGMHLEQAEKMIRDAVGKVPRSMAYLDSLGWVLYKQGDFPGAYEWLTKAARAPLVNWQSWLFTAELRRGEDDPVIRDHLGDAAWRLNKKDQAVACWRRAHELVTADADDLLSPEQQAILENQPAKIEAALHGGQPEVAPVGLEH